MRGILAGGARRIDAPAVIAAMHGRGGATRGRRAARGKEKHASTTPSTQASEKNGAPQPDP